MYKIFSRILVSLCLLSLQSNGQIPVLIRGPYLQVATDSSMVIRWRTDIPAASRVNYGMSPDKLEKTVNDDRLTGEHIVRLSGLKPHTRYFYSIGNTGQILQSGNENYFYTLPEQGKTGFYRIAAFGDCGNNSVNQVNVRDHFLKYLGNNYLDAWILLGDNAYSSGQDAEFQQKFFNIYKDNLLKKYPLFPSPGNHDYKDGKSPGSDSIAMLDHQMAYYQDFSMPVKGESGGVASNHQAFYSFDIGNIHFISLDSYGMEENQYRIYDTLGPQVVWVKQDLEAARSNRQWVVAYWHHPPYTMGSHNSDEETELVKIRENFIRILERYGVDIIICGHSHVYERSRLMRGNYGAELTFNPLLHNLSSSSGLYDTSLNSCPYIKGGDNQGTVYVVSGSAGQLGGMEKAWPHAAMFYSNAQNGGASIIEVEGNRLDLKWICADGVIRDHFTMMKGVNRDSVINIRKGQRLVLSASYVGRYRWNRSKQHTRSIKVTPGLGTTKYIVSDGLGCVKDVFTVRVKPT